MSEVGGSNCRRAAMSIGTATQEVLLAESTPNAGDGCGLVSNGFYVVAVYVEDANGLNDGQLSLLQVHVSPQKGLSNILGAGPIMAENPSSSNVKLKFVAVQAGRQGRSHFHSLFAGIGPLFCQGTGHPFVKSLKYLILLSV